MLSLADAKNIQPNRLGGICQVEQDDIASAMLGNSGQYVADQIAFGVDKGQAITGLHVLDCHIGQQSRFADPHRADHVEMPEPIVSPQPQQLLVTRIVALGNGDAAVTQSVWRG